MASPLLSLIVSATAGEGGRERLASDTTKPFLEEITMERGIGMFPPASSDTVPDKLSNFLSSLGREEDAGEAFGRRIILTTIRLGSGRGRVKPEED